MKRSHFWRAFFAAAWLSLAMTSRVSSAEPPMQEWLRGTSQELQIRLHGEVLEADGRPATEASVACSLNNNGRQTRLETAIDGNHFEVWIPVNAAGSFSLWLRATSSDGERVAYHRLNAYELRQTAIDGLKLKLASPTREKRFLVTYQGKPVADANVKVELGFGIETRAKSSADGLAKINLLSDQEINQITVWTDDRLIGGFSFDREPTRDPNDDQFTVELSRCRDQLLRFVDEAGSPVPTIESTIQIATPSPAYNYLGTNENSHLTSDPRGEVVYRWFPDWEKQHCYVDLVTPGWVLVTNEPESAGDALVFRLRKSAPRKRIHGHVDAHGTTPGGFYVSLDSFQGEQEHRMDIASTFTNTDGSFEMSILPDARYCAWVLDSLWVSNIIDLIPYSSALDQTNPPQLVVSAGQEVEVVATIGPEEKPYSNLGIHFRREHDYEWQENGETRSGSTGPQFWAITDEHGHATARTAPGKMRVSVYSPKWRTEQEVTVRRGKLTHVQLHRESAERRRGTGRIVIAPELKVLPRDVQIQVAAVDGFYNDEQSPDCDDDGSFSFESLATTVGIFAATSDGRAAGSQIVRDFGQPAEVVLLPTATYEGRLLDNDDRPFVNYHVLAIARVANEEHFDSPYSTSFDARRCEARTDTEGNFTLAGLPCGMAIQLLADDPVTTSESRYLEQVFLQPEERRTREVHRMPRNGISRNEEPLAERFRDTLRDCALNGYRPLLILTSGGRDAADFVENHFVDGERSAEVSRFMPVVVDCEPDRLNSADAAFVAERDWQRPSELFIVAYVLGIEGEELDQLDVDLRDEAAADNVAAFLHRHLPPVVDAEMKWSAAFDEARSTNRRVWARVSGRYCGPCFRLSRWLDDQRELLEKDYVLLKIDAGHNRNGEAVAERLTQGKHFGIPFYAIFDADGKMLIDSAAGPLGNIGYPASFEGKRHLRKMLAATHKLLTDAEIDQLVTSVGD